MGNLKEDRVEPVAEVVDVESRVLVVILHAILRKVLRVSIGLKRLGLGKLFDFVQLESRRNAQYRIK